MATIDDEEAIIVSSIDIDGRTLRAVEPLVFIVNKDSQAGRMYICDNEFGIYASASHYKALIDEVVTELRFLWKEYACEADERMTASAQALARLLRQKFVLE